MIARARTLAQIRLLESLGPLPRARARALPRAQHPDHIVAAYGDRLVRLVVRPLVAATAQAKREILHALTATRRARGHHDAGEEDQARAAIEHAAKRAAGDMRPHELHAAAAQFGKETTDFQRRQLSRQINAAIGVPFEALERPIRDLVPAFTSSNVELVKTVPDRYFERLRRDVAEAFATGEHPATLAERFIELDDMAEGDAMRIARDQIGKLNGQVNQERQESLGVEEFTWRTMRDNRVRDSHEKLEGETYRWDDPPIDDDSGEEITPGSAIQCRCFAEPVLDTLTHGDDD